MLIKPGDSKVVLAKKLKDFRLFESQEQEMIANNFKAALSGNLNEKLFEINMQNSEFNEKVKELLESSSNDEFRLKADNIIPRMLDFISSNKNISVNFLEFTYETEHYSFDFVMVTVNEAEQGEKLFQYDSDESDIDFKTNFNAIVNLKSPIEAFMYPVLNEGTLEFDRLLYYTKKSNKPNNILIEEVFNGQTTLPKKDEKIAFDMILNKITDDNMSIERLSNIYKTIDYTYSATENSDEKILTTRELERVIDSENIEKKEEVSIACQEILGKENHSFNVDSILPEMSKKSVVLTNSSIDLKISPQKLTNIKVVKDEKGKRFLLVDLSEKLSIGELELSEGKIDTISFEKEGE